jgi:hypothetical protein
MRFEQILEHYFTGITVTRWLSTATAGESAAEP